ncbi:MAG: peptidoglycan D,D-transpeptidase FtsI family protein [Ramlibacter sp.]
MTRSVLYTSSPLLASKTPVWRSKLVVAVIALAFIGLAGRAAWVQVFGNDFFQRQGEVRFARTIELPATRGRILDRNGMLLATSVPAPSVMAIPDSIDRDKPRLKQLAELLEMPLADLEKKLQFQGDGSKPVWLRRQVEDAVAEKVVALGIKGVLIRKEYKRQYPEGEAAAHVVGFTGIDDQGHGQGLEGIEKTFDKDLAGRSGSRRVIKDRLGNIVEDVREQVPPLDGQDLQLSIDSKVQFFAYQRLRDAVIEHKAKAGSIVVLDVQSGEVLALANYPSYSPSKRVNVSIDQMRNRALVDMFEPGSTVKPFIAALALERGLVRPDTQIQPAPGRIYVSGMPINDSSPHGVLTVNEVIQKSSNVGTVKMAMQLEPRDMWEMYSGVGFGQRPQLPFPGVVSGRLPAYKSWRPIGQATMSYGYGLSGSLFQLARAYSVFARDGELVPVTLLKADRPAAGVRVFDKTHAAQVRHMLHLATGPGGTAPKAQTVGYSVGGKTGTARKTEGKGYVEGKYRGFFVGLAPIERPRIVVAVMIDEPRGASYYGGEVAAPVFSATVQQTLRIMGLQPDMTVKPQVVVAVEESF